MEIRADFQALVSETTRLDEASDDLSARVRQVRERVEDLLAVGWTGDAASAFRPLFDA
ncbi:WXG100 family type VII secretion target [Microbacterium sp. 20-116]